MLNIAKKKNYINKSNIIFNNQDAKKINLNLKFELIISLFHVINYMNSYKELDDLFKSFAKLIKPKSMLVFDSWYGPSVLKFKPKKTNVKIKTRDLIITRRSQPDFLFDKNIVNVNYDFKVNANNGKKIYTHKETHQIRYFFTEEITYFLKKNGFNLKRAMTYDLQDPTLKDWSVIYIAEKK